MDAKTVTIPPAHLVVRPTSEATTNGLKPLPRMRALRTRAENTAEEARQAAEAFNARVQVITGHLLAEVERLVAEDEEAQRLNTAAEKANEHAQTVAKAFGSAMEAYKKAAKATLMDPAKAVLLDKPDRTSIKVTLNGITLNAAVPDPAWRVTPPKSF